MASQASSRPVPGSGAGATALVTNPAASSHHNNGKMNAFITSSHHKRGLMATHHKSHDQSEALIVKVGLQKKRITSSHHTREMI